LPNLVLLGQTVRALFIKEISLKNLTLVSRLSRSLKVIGTDTYRSAIYEFLLKFHSNHWIISYRPTVTVINGDFSRKSHIFPTPVYSALPLKESSWNWVSAHGAKKLEWWATGSRKKP